MEEFKICPNVYAQRIESIAKRSYQLPMKREKSFKTSNCPCGVCNAGEEKVMMGEKSISLPPILKRQSQSFPSPSTKGKLSYSNNTKRKLTIMERLAQKEKFQQEIIDQIVAEEKLADEKFHKIGEEYIQSIYTRAAERKMQNGLYRAPEKTLV